MEEEECGLYFIRYMFMSNEEMCNEFIDRKKIKCGDCYESKVVGFLYGYL